MTATTTSSSFDSGRLSASWPWPLDLARYDRRALVTGAEAKALGALEIKQIRRLGLTPQAAPQRLVEPLAHARDCLQWARGHRQPATIRPRRGRPGPDPLR
ncbi:hypothetical protein [Streptomyces malaysiensis]|uniref:hypothetical protein n=1 Tax=Streptomyces malaysiensis TaxID=92644 RepID=UPI002B308495|nr:hypothetical protein R8789_00680 [Streptomyces malaysiensis]